MLTDASEYENGGVQTSEAGDGWISVRPQNCLDRNISFFLVHSPF